MSIHQINKLFQNKGCNIAMSVVLGISVITMLGYGTRGCSPQGQGPDQQEAHMAPVVTVGDLKISPDMVRNPQSESKVGTERMSSEGQQIDQLITGGLALILAKKEGVDLSDNSVKQHLIQNSLTVARQVLEENHLLRPGANEQEFESAFKLMNNISLPDARKSIENQIDTSLKTDEGKSKAQASAAPLLLVEKYKSRFNPNEDDVKKQFDTYTIKEIIVSEKLAGVKASDPKAKAAMKAKADAILKEIRGGLSFEAAMDKYLEKPLDKKAKASDSTIPIPADKVLAYPFISKLKPGEVSDVQVLPAAPVIVKLVSHKIELPKDYETQKGTLLDQEKQMQAQKFVTDELKKLDTPANVKWDNEGYHILHDFLAITPTDPDRIKKLKALIDRAMTAQNTPLGADAAIAAARLAVRDVAATLPAADGQKLTTTVLAAYVQQFPELDAKIELAEAYLKAGDGENAGTTLKDVAEVNSVRTDAEGKANWDALNKAIKEGTDKKLLSATVLKDLSTAYAKWQKDYADEQEQKKQDEAERKKTEDELNKAGKEPAVPNNPAPGTPPTNRPKPEPPKSTPPKSGPSSVLHPESNTTGKH